MSDTLQKEEAFHDSWAQSSNVHDVLVDESFEACTSPENKIIIRNLGSYADKRILELGCGRGEASVYFAKKGARVTATDISSGMLQKVQELAQAHKTTLKTMQCYSHTLPFPDHSFDIVYAANLLHHVDIESTLQEVKRVLTSDGIFVSWDPIAYNPLINIYRKKAMQVRTEDEHPLTLRDIRTIKKIFPHVRYEMTWFTTLWIFVKFYLQKIDPNKERYWKKILTDHKQLEKSYTRLAKLDRIILTVLPFLKWWCWNIVLICRNEK